MTSQIRRSGPAPPASRGAEDDATLIRAPQLEPERFAGLFRRHAPVLQRYVTRRLGPDAAEDVVAETFLTAFRQRGQYDQGRPDARPWLYGIATNLIGRHRRSSDQPAYPAGQWFYVRERFAAPQAGLGPGSRAAGTLTYWRTAGPAPELHGPGVTSTKESTYRRGRTKVWGQEAWLANGRRTAGQVSAIAAGPGGSLFRISPSCPRIRRR
jgi:hypothetical protein